MLFNSPEYLLGLLPLSILLYYLFIAMRIPFMANVSLVGASLFFYGYWNPIYLPLIMGSISVNYIVGSLLAFIPRHKTRSRTILLGFFVLLNLAFLGYYKYANFFVGEFNALMGTAYYIQTIVLPLGISFFTFTQIAYIVDAYRGECKEHNFIHYTLFVTFFPHLIAGPIIHHKEMMSQFDDSANHAWLPSNIALGLLIFSIGFFKKTVLADTLSVWADYGFNTVDQLNMVTAWITVLSYSFQLYFDFSGYTDMAVGSALFFNIKLPNNFNSPYKAVNIRDFWNRWHITLSRFLRDYLYIPLGGNRFGSFRTSFNLFMTLLLGGIWHGAGWNFFIWGGLHGIAMVIHRWWSRTLWHMPAILAQALTFFCVVMLWVPFRAKTVHDTTSIYGTLFNFAPIDILGTLKDVIYHTKYVALHLYTLKVGEMVVPMGVSAQTLVLLCLLFIVVMTGKNTYELMKNPPRSMAWAMVWAAGLMGCGLLTFMSETPSKFLYFQF